jgi:hypothetical protein
MLLRDQRGVALPLSMIVLLLMTSLMIAFVALTRSEPVIAANHLRAARARALAESGVERALWAVANPGVTGGLAADLTGAAGAPYDGATEIAVHATGVFQVDVTGVAPLERAVIAVGTFDPDNPLNRARKRIQLILHKLKVSVMDPPAALTVRGQLQVTGNATVDARGDTSCGGKYGTYSKDATLLAGSSAVYGADGDNTRNEPGQDWVQNQTHDPNDPNNAFTKLRLGPGDLDALKEIAKSQGTYYQGTVAFNSSNRLPNGVVFVDTVSGNNIPDDIAQQNTADFASVGITGNPTQDPTGFHGVLIVNGSLAVAGNGLVADGLLYAINDINISGTPTINGAAISWNIRDTIATTIDTSVTGNNRVNFLCTASHGEGWVPQSWFVKAGSYRELSDLGDGPPAPRAHRWARAQRK